MTVPPGRPRRIRARASGAGRRPRAWAWSLAAALLLAPVAFADPLDDAREALTEAAADDWRTLQRRLDAGQADAAEVERFLDRYRRATVRVGGRTYPVVIPQVPRAEAALEDLVAPSDPVARIQALDGTDFFRRAGEVVVDTYDRDGSGVIDQPEELSRIPCEVWTALAEGLMQADAPSLQSAPDRAFGVDRSLGAEAGAMLEICVAAPLLDSLEDRARSEEPGDDPAGPTDASGPRSGDGALASAVAELPDGGTTTWDARVQRLLLAAVDDDRTGAIDRPAELRGIDCATWRTIDAGVRDGWSEGVRDLYGFSSGERIWLGYALGVDAAMRVEADGAMAACGLSSAVAEGQAPVLRGPLPAVEPAAVAERIAALPEPGRASWDLEVTRLLVGAFDADGDRRIGAGPDEVGAIPCAVWQTIDDAVRQAWPRGFAVTYGVDDDDQWIGSALGLGDDAQRPLRSRLRSCDVPYDAPSGPASTRAGGPAGPGVDDRPRASFAPTGDPVADRIHALPDGGSDAWDAAVRAVLVEAYDTDGDGVLGQVAEVVPVPCGVWRALDAGVEAGWGSGLYVVYGFDPARSWVGDALGFGEDVREAAAERLGACGVGPDPVGAAGGAISPLVRRLSELPGGGSMAWEASVREAVVAVYDRDDSGRLDASAELSAVPCEVWRTLDIGVREAWDAGLFQTYGFGDDQYFLGGALGVGESLQDEAGDALRRCGLGEDRAVLAPDQIATAVRAVAHPGGSEPWDADVGALLVETFDRSGDGTLDRTDEVRSIPCSVWHALDDGVREGWDNGLATVYGFTAETTWVGYVLGFDLGVRAIAFDALDTCLSAPDPIAPHPPGTPAQPGLGTRPDAAPDAVTPSVRVGVTLLSSQHQVGSEPWALEARRALLRAFDLDASGLLDRRREIRAVGCEVWRALNDVARRRWGLSAREAWGTARGTLWHGDRLGLHERARRPADRALRRCLAE